MEQLKIFGGIAAIGAAIFFFAPKGAEEQVVTEPVVERGFSSKETSARFVAPTAPVEE